jgi:hypothetical protein
MGVEEDFFFMGGVKNTCVPPPPPPPKFGTALTVGGSRDTFYRFMHIKKGGGGEESI